ncbi:MAG: hypothetical protein DRQ89_06655 [Epsilonproteobacteria bacterium]|nr:MAG: hypothetical protein DRQ89_06655 [Campylobacterota bacterium]
MIRYLIILSLTLSCSINNLSPRNVSEYSKGPKIVKYYLPELPNWANISNSGNCKRTVSNKYLNFRSLGDDFSFSYKDLVQFQYLYNIEYQKLIKQADRGILPFSEEEKLFYDVFDKIKTQLYTFRRPSYKRVNLVWVDQIRKKNLKKLMRSRAMNEGHPVFVSLCLNQNELLSFIEQNGFSRKDVRALSFEIFSPYNKKLVTAGKTSLDFSRLFSKRQKLYFYTPKGVLPPEFIGNFKIRRY